MSASTITFEQVVTGIDLTPSCETSRCRPIGTPATHVKIIALPCHRYEFYLCAACAERQRAALEKDVAHDPHREWGCIVCRAKHQLPLAAVVDVRPL